MSRSPHPKSPGYAVPKHWENLHQSQSSISVVQRPTSSQCSQEHRPRQHSKPPTPPFGRSPSAARREILEVSTSHGVPGSNNSSPHGVKRRGLPPTPPSGAAPSLSSGRSPKRHNDSVRKSGEGNAVAQRRSRSESPAGPAMPIWRHVYAQDARPSPGRRRSQPPKSPSVCPQAPSSPPGAASVTVARARPLAGAAKPRVSSAEVRECRATLEKHLRFRGSSSLASLHPIDQELPSESHLSQKVSINETTREKTLSRALYNESTLSQPFDDWSMPSASRERTLSQALYNDKTLSQPLDNWSMPSASRDRTLSQALCDEKTLSQPFGNWSTPSHAVESSQRRTPSLPPLQSPLQPDLHGVAELTASLGRTRPGDRALRSRSSSRGL
eukprot:TRINITY_DN3370_c0_g1_i1.p1 TRINITY_DN3370_c0_g1~~TRINITY_DN3370_c0_g1_i1.p1  ORF type:complete len:406 (+),score=24.02 TRINITY_DN3370_c0_g1_i1:65-1219(+)